MLWCLCCCCSLFFRRTWNFQQLSSEKLSDFKNQSVRAVREEREGKVFRKRGEGRAGGMEAKKERWKPTEQTQRRTREGGKGLMCSEPNPLMLTHTSALTSHSGELGKWPLLSSSCELLIDYQGDCTHVPPKEQCPVGDVKGGRWLWNGPLCEHLTTVTVNLVCEGVNVHVSHRHLSMALS